MWQQLLCVTEQTRLTWHGVSVEHRLCGRHRWLHQPFSVDWLRHNIKIRLRDQLIQKWHEGISQSRKCTNYKIFKNIIGFEKNLIELPEELRKYLTKLRCRIHHLPIEIGCDENVLRDMRICQHCRKDISDEYHYLLCCPQFRHERTKYLDSIFWKKPSAIQMEKAMTNVNLRKLCIFVKFIFSQF